jgi:predicted ATPase
LAPPSPGADTRRTREDAREVALVGKAEGEGDIQQRNLRLEQRNLGGLDPALHEPLRAATSLARLWRSQGRLDEAREQLASVYGRFTEGFATADLRAARLLLDELAQSCARA